MEIIPAIDIIDGKCVRLKQGEEEGETVVISTEYSNRFDLSE